MRNFKQSRPKCSDYALFEELVTAKPNEMHNEKEKKIWKKERNQSHCSKDEQGEMRIVCRAM